MNEIHGKSILVRVSARFELSRFDGSQLGLHICSYLVRFSLFAFVIIVCVIVEEMSIVGLPEHPTTKLLYLVIYVFFIIIFFFFKSKIIDVCLSLVDQDVIVNCRL